MLASHLVRPKRYIFFQGKQWQLNFLRRIITTRFFIRASGAASRQPLPRSEIAYIGGFDAHFRDMGTMRMQVTAYTEKRRFPTCPYP